MKVYKMIRESEQLFAFEIDNIYIRPRKIAKLLDAVDGVSNISLRKPFCTSSDIHLEFKYCGKDFIVWEPYGDSSRYWIGPKQDGCAIDISILVKVFEEYKLPRMVKVFGDLIAFNFKPLW